MAGKILIVDDQANMCWILSKILVEAGFSVETAHTGSKALSIIARGGIAAAIVDYRLPDMNGIELFDTIKSAYWKIPAILITSYGSKTLREEARRAGFAEYFDKPFRNQALVATLRNVLP
ncbi:MAG: response regulator [Nitrospinae bacterium]|nr:response regulator [Nitrospinota bacterium]